MSFQSRVLHSNLTFRDKFFSLDFILLFSILILGIISMFAMFSSSGGIFDYQLGHIIRFIFSFYFFNNFFFSL